MKSVTLWECPKCGLVTGIGQGLLLQHTFCYQHGETVPCSPIEYVPAAEAEALEGAAKDLDIALAKHFRISDGERTLGWGTPDGLELLDETESGGLAAAWRELRRKLGIEEG